MSNNKQILFNDHFQKEWKNIPEFDGLYQVSNTGEVRSVDRLVNHNRKLIKERKAA